MYYLATSQTVLWVGRTAGWEQHRPLVRAARPTGGLLITAAAVLLCGLQGLALTEVLALLGWETSNGLAG
jgi:hypothetical protein